MWPTYQMTHHASVHALGVVSVNFANYERAVTWVFAAVARKAEDDARSLHAHDGTTACIAKIEEASHQRAWSGRPNELVHHFIEASRILIRNRNLLMHSVMVSGPNTDAILFRTGKRGEREMVEATLDQIRAVADDLYGYFNFAAALANCIAIKVDRDDRRAGTIVIYEWPEAPVLPVPLLRPTTS